MTDWVAALGADDARVVALVGGGGKTTLGFALAHYWYDKGERILLTTTTRMAADQMRGPWPVVEGLEALLGTPHASCLAYAHRSDGGKKVTGFPVGDLEAVIGEGRFDRVIVEADGSAHRPLKAPAAYEPVVPRSTDRVIAVAGLWGLGMPFDESTVFRTDRWATLTGAQRGQPVTAADLAAVAAHRFGLFQGAPAGAPRTLLLNGCETADDRALARRVAQALAAVADHGVERVVAGRLMPSPELAPLSGERRP